MQQFQKYKYDPNNPLTQPYKKDGVYNAYYKGKDTQKGIDVLISEYSQPKNQRLNSKQKRLQKLKDIKHPNIVEIYNITFDKQNKKLYVVIQWCQGGHLYDYQKSYGTIDCDLAVKIVMELADGLKAIHQSQMHRYINMENIQFDSKGKPKLSFRCLYPKTYYMSPQDIQGTRTKQNDIFSLGVLLYKVLLNNTPFKGNGLDQQIRLIQQGPKFPKDQDKMFPLGLPVEIKNLIVSMTKFKASQRLTAQEVKQQCGKYINKMCKTTASQPNIPSSTMKKIFKNQFIPLFVRHTSAQEHIIIALNLQKNQFTKFHIYKSKSKSSLTNYVQTVLSPYRQVKDDMQIVPIYETYIIDDQFLVIRTFYDNQGSLKNYLEHSGTIRLQHARTFITKLMQKLKKYGKTHNHLTNQNILIKGGMFYINYPPFLTKQYLNSLKNSKGQADFIAPQVKQGKSSENADAWSVAMLKYMLQNQQMPKFDKNGKVVLPNKSKRSPQQIKFFESALEKDPQKRKGLFQPEKQQVPAPSSRRQSAKQSTIQNVKQIPIKQIRKKPKPIVPSIILPNPGGKQKGSKKSFGQVLTQKLGFFQHLQKHWTKPLRVGIKCLIGLILQIFLFYLSFFLINGKLLTQHSLYQPKIIHIRGFTNDATPQIQYNLVTKTPLETYNLFYNETLSTLRDDYKCVLNDYSVQSNVVEVINQKSFTAYQIFGILFSIINLIIFCLSLSKMDFPKIFFISNLEQNNFNQVWNWMFINMAFASQISLIYLLYGSLFHMDLQPCLSKATLTAVQFLLKRWYFSFNIRYIWVYLGLVFSYMVIIFFIAKPKYIVHRILKGVLVALYLAGVFCRIMGGSGGYIAWQKQSVFGKVGELLLLIISVLCFLLDLVFGCNVKSQYNEQAKVNRIADDSMNEINATQENFLPE